MGQVAWQASLQRAGAGTPLAPRSPDWVARLRGPSCSRRGGPRLYDPLLPPRPLPTCHRSISVDDMRVEEMTAAHYLAFKEKLVPVETGERGARVRVGGTRAAGALGCRCCWRCYLGGWRGGWRGLALPAGGGRAQPEVGGGSGSSVGLAPQAPPPAPALPGPQSKRC